MEKSLVGRSLFGVELGEGNVLKEDITYLFTPDYEVDDELILKVNKDFECDFFDTGKPIKYNFYLSIMDMRDYDEEDYRPCITLNLLPTMESINKKLINQILSDYYGDGVNVNGLRFKDIVDEAFPCILVDERLDFPKDWEWKEDTFDEIIETASLVIPAINSMIGFYMDRPTNRIGTTNWDWLKDLLDENYEAIPESLNRLK